MEKESDHLDDFAPELAMVTKFGNEDRRNAAGTTRSTLDDARNPRNGGRRCTLCGVMWCVGLASNKGHRHKEQGRY